MADYMEDALIATFEHGPEALDSISVSHINDILTYTVVDCLMIHISHSLVAKCFISVDRGSWIDVIPDKPFQGSCISAFDYPGANLASLAVFNASHNSLTYRTTSSLLFAFVMAHVLTFASNESLISFNRTIETR